MRRSNMKKKTYITIAAVCGAVFGLSLAVLPELEAAIPVTDSSNIAQQYKTYLQTYQTVINTAKQITLQIQELKTLPSGTLSQYQSILNQEVSTMQTSLSNTSGVLNPQKTLSSVWNSTFEPAGIVTANNITGSKVSAINGATISALDQANYDSFNVVKTAINNMKQTQSNLDQLMTLNTSAEGQKQSTQINNMLLAEQAKLLQQQNMVRAAEGVARITYYQRQNQLDALADAQCNQAANSIMNMAKAPLY